MQKIFKPLFTPLFTPIVHSAGNVLVVLPVPENCIFWAEAQLETGLNDLDIIETLTDQSGNSTIVTQSNAVQRFAYRTNQLNGKAAYQADEVDDIMKNASYIWTNDFITVFAICWFTDVDPNVDFMNPVFSVGSDVNTEHFGGFSDRNNVPVVHVKLAGRVDTAIATNQTIASVTKYEASTYNLPMICGWKIPKSNVGNFLIEFNKLNEAYTSSSPIAPTGFNNGFTLHGFNLLGAIDQYTHAMMIASIAVCDGEVTEQEKAFIYDYYTAQFGV